MEALIMDVPDFGKKTGEPEGSPVLQTGPGES
jgi:hypothetical protein